MDHIRYFYYAGTTLKYRYCTKYWCCTKIMRICLKRTSTEMSKFISFYIMHITCKVPNLLENLSRVDGRLFLTLPKLHNYKFLLTGARREWKKNSRLELLQNKYRKTLPYYYTNPFFLFPLGTENGIARILKRVKIKVG